MKLFLHCNRYRYYNPQTAQYLSPDLLGLEGGFTCIIRMDGLILWGWLVKNVMGGQRTLERKEEMRHIMVKSLSMSRHRTMTNPAQALEEELIPQPFFLVMPKQFIKNQIDSDLKDLIEELPDDQKEVLLMRIYKDMSFKEISENTGVSINTALGRMRYALINLRKIIEKHNIVLTN